MSHLFSYKGKSLLRLATRNLLGILTATASETPADRALYALVCIDGLAQSTMQITVQIWILDCVAHWNPPERN